MFRHVTYQGADFNVPVFVWHHQACSVSGCCRAINFIAALSCMPQEPTDSLCRKVINLFCTALIFTHFVTAVVTYWTRYT
jgi:hypothetical protein